MTAYPYYGDLNSTENNLYREFEAHANEFVSKLLHDYKPQKYKSSKVIHDCVWGSVMFYPWELQIMDSPLLQRLRNINQLGLALYTYPSAHHSRFEHTLGVVAVASKMIDSINNGKWGEKDSGFTISKEHVYMIRMAALLHDVGHCFFSHLSEVIYSENDEFKKLKQSFSIFNSAQAHEILGYVITTSPAFCEFFSKRIDYPYKGRSAFSAKALLNNIGRMIVGAFPDPQIDSENNMILPYYLTEMINGQFDADSLDYLRRDSYATGLELRYNLDRFLYKIRIVETEEKVNDMPILGQHLTVPTSGISTVEEMIYNKQMLTRYIYQHHKVMTVESLVYDIVYGLMNNGMLKHPCDFLYLCDYNIFMLSTAATDFKLPVADLKIDGSTERTVADLVRRISVRNFPKKAFVINSHTIKGINGKSPCSVLEISQFINKYKCILREEIYNEALKIRDSLPKCNENAVSFDMYDIQIAIPKYSLSKDYSNVYVLSNDNVTLVPLSDITDLNDIANSFANNSWSAYIFADSSILPIVSIAAKNVIERLGADISLDALTQFKHQDRIHELLRAIHEA